MSLDQQGNFWLSDPWVATLTIVVVVGLLLWCQFVLAADPPQRSAAVPVRAQRVPRPHRPSVRHVSRQVAIERARRDASHRRVA